MEPSWKEFCERNCTKWKWPSVSRAVLHREEALADLMNQMAVSLSLDVFPACRMFQNKVASFSCAARPEGTKEVAREDGRVGRQ